MKPEAKRDLLRKTLKTLKMVKVLLMERLRRQYIKDEYQEQSF